MKFQPLVELKRKYNRWRYAGLRPGRAATRNVTAVWAIAAMGLFFGVWLRMYAGETDVTALLESTAVEWRDAVDHVTSSVPKAVGFVAGESSWEAAALQSTLPRPVGGDEGATTNPPWQSLLHLLFGLLLGYDPAGAEGALAAALPAAGPGSDPSLPSSGSPAGGPPSRSTASEPTPGLPQSFGNEADADGPSGPASASGAGPGTAGGLGNGSETGTDSGSDAALGSGTALGSDTASGSVIAADRATGVPAEGALPSTGPSPSDPGRVEGTPGEEESVPASASMTRRPGSGAETGSEPESGAGGRRPPTSEQETGGPPETPSERVADAAIRETRIPDPSRNDLSTPRLSPSGSCRVLIFHTHTSETYRTGEGADASDGHYLWNSTNSGILHVGRALANALEEKYAVPTCHATDIHDWPSHPRAYIESRHTVESYLQRYPQIDLVLDIHRDSPPELVTTVAGRSVARVAVVVGTHPTMHPRSATNVALAQHFARRLEVRYPGMFRRIIERPDARLNQDLHPRMLLLEIGSYDTHLDEAVAAAELLAEVVADLVVDIRLQRLAGVGPPR